MAFGEQSGPPASRSQVNELLELLANAGHTGFKDARGPMRFTQRQAAGKFTRDEADAYIADLQAAAYEADDVGPSAPRRSPVAPATRAAPRPQPAPPPAPKSDIAKFTDAELAAELQRRGWVVMEP